jgi:cation diffusion facilitator CzcD-associated flavoprotein CzcO
MTDPRTGFPNGRPAVTTDVDAAIVGAGFAGLYAIHKLRGLGLSVVAFEAGTGVGGTWYWNRYPGARCDVPSMEYSYQFDEALQQEWEWTERYASQPEILRYLNHVADRFDLRREIRFETRVESAAYDDATERWTVTTDRGDRVSAKFVILATGCLSTRNTPDFAGLDSFRGETFHTGNWPHDGVDFTGKRVGVIGTGSSAVQSIPMIADQAEHLHVFQRTPTYSIPARNRPLDPEEQRAVKADYRGLRRRVAALPFGFDVEWNDVPALSVSEAERRAEYERRWAKGGAAFYGVFADLLLSEKANETAAEFLREKIRAIVKDAKTADLLTPTQTFGCKRICLDTEYFETFNRPNVTLVDVASTPIERLTEKGLRTTEREYELDAIVFATGFDAMTGAILRIDVRGKQGLALREKWAEGPKTYLGLSIAGFPNLWTITGPQSPSVLSNMVPSIEQHVNWIADQIEWMRARGHESFEATPEAEESWVTHVNELAMRTLFYTCNSWYLGANIPGKPRVFMPYLGFSHYVNHCEGIRARGYEGFAFSGGEPERRAANEG